MNKLTAAQVKTAVIHNMMWCWHYIGAVTEYVHDCDILGIRQSMFTVEVEVKVAKYDLLNEIKDIRAALQEDELKPNLFNTRISHDNKIHNHNKFSKHRTYLNKVTTRYKPNEFYFCVPIELRELALKEMENIPYYGLYIAHSVWNVEIAKRGKKLHETKFENNEVLMHFFRKLSYEANGLREKLYYAENTNRMV